MQFISKVISYRAANGVFYLFLTVKYELLIAKGDAVAAFDGHVLSRLYTLSVYKSSVKGIDVCYYKAFRCFSYLGMELSDGRIFYAVIRLVLKPAQNKGKLF